MISRGVTRRRVLGVVAGGATAMGLSRPGLASQATPSTGWSFTDDKGVTVTLDAAPERLAIDLNAAAALWDFGVRPAAVFGWDANETGDFGDAGGNIDPDAVEIAGTTAEPVQLEKLASVDPELIITLTWTPGDPGDYWSFDPEILPQAQEIAPILAMSATGRADANTERFAELAASLGADLETPELAEAKSAYDAAMAELETTAAEKVDLTILFLYIDAETLYIANPPDWADLAFYQSMGVGMVEPDAEDGSFWEELSQEQALKYPADVIMASSRPGALTPEELASHPTFSAHPAVQAGQVTAWNQDFIQSYQGMTEAMTHLTETLRGAGKAT